MGAILIRGRYLIPEATLAPIEDGAVVVDGGRIVAIGRHEDLRGRSRDLPTVG